MRHQTLSLLKVLLCKHLGSVVAWEDEKYFKFLIQTEADAAHELLGRICLHELWNAVDVYGVGWFGKGLSHGNGINSQTGVLRLLPHEEQQENNIK